MDKEVEFKFAVNGKTDFQRLLDHLDLAGLAAQRTSLQTNHFFDTPAFDVHAARMVLRLREDAGIHTLTFKCAQGDLSLGGCASERIEIEAVVGPNVALKLLQGDLSPIQALEERTSETNRTGLALLRNAIGQAPLTYIGCFKNERTLLKDVPLKVAGESVALTFELDCSSFAPDEQEYEIEVELEAAADLGPTHSALTKLLSDAGIDWHSAASKSQRFYARKPSPT